MLQYLPALITLALVAAQIAVIVYLDDLEKKGCKCAMDYRRQYILIYTAVMVGLALLNFFGNYVVRGLAAAGALVTALYTIGVVAAGVTNIVFIFQYVQKLKDEKCGCSESVYRDLMYGLGILSSIVYGVAAIGIAYTGVMVAPLLLSGKRR